MKCGTACTQTWAGWWKNKQHLWKINRKAETQLKKCKEVPVFFFPSFFFFFSFFNTWCAEKMSFWKCSLKEIGFHVLELKEKHYRGGPYPCLGRLRKPQVPASLFASQFSSSSLHGCFRHSSQNKQLAGSLHPHLLYPFLFQYRNKVPLDKKLQSENLW